MEMHLNQMSESLIIIGLIIGVVILLNVGIFIRFRKGSRTRDMPYKAFGQAIDIFKNPWKKEDQQIEELSTLLDSIEENTEKSE